MLLNFLMGFCFETQAASVARCAWVLARNRAEVDHRGNRTCALHNAGGRRGRARRPRQGDQIFEILSAINAFSPPGRYELAHEAQSRLSVEEFQCDAAFAFAERWYALLWDGHDAGRREDSSRFHSSAGGRFPECGIRCLLHHPHGDPQAFAVAEH